MSAGGDVGRRIEERRDELGMSRAEVARRAGMDETYLLSLERSPAPSPSRGALWRLAAALETTIEALSGAGATAPHGHGAPSAQATLEEIDEAACERLVAPGGVGRVVYVDGEKPVALPMNFRMLDGSVVFRTAESSPLTSATPPEPVSFEVDHVDDALREGWSVLMTGSVELVSGQDERARVDALGLEPWAGGSRSTYVRLAPRYTTGRRIRAH